jgi:hypothetical protein
MTDNERLADAVVELRHARAEIHAAHELLTQLGIPRNKIFRWFDRNDHTPLSLSDRIDRLADRTADRRPPTADPPVRSRPWVTVAANGIVLIDPGPRPQNQEG